MLDEETLRNGATFAFVTSFGDFDCLAMPQGSGEYTELVERAGTAEFEGGVMRVASIDDLIWMKRATGRPKDLIAVDILEAIRQPKS
ncbi:MAG: hypothetical protein QOI98_3486 [Solirubrobacteraceae bacterium]|nr:hypothetical protein [Solirubrobacteraceae bacterium]